MTTSQKEAIINSKFSCHGQTHLYLGPERLLAKFLAMIGNYGADQASASPRTHVTNALRNILIYILNYMLHKLLILPASRADSGH